MSISCQDPVIGLDVGGRLFYTHQSTLTNVEDSYFAARFRPDSMIPAGDEYQDAHGRSVYFIDRDGDLFHHIMTYLRNPHERPLELSELRQNPGMWIRLRREAEFYGLDGLVELLKITHSCSPSEGDRGVLYWLGTAKGTESVYTNPYTSGALKIGGWMDMTKEELLAQGGYMTDFAMEEVSRNEVGFDGSRANFVEYRPQNHPEYAGVPVGLMSVVLYCYHAGYSNPVVIDLRAIRVRLSHYSLRYEDCRGMEGDWNFEGSLDGASWDVLHAARKDGHLLEPSNEESVELNRLSAEFGSDEEAKIQFRTSYAERHHRHTWSLMDPTAPSQFYRYFRIIGADKDSENRYSHNGCLHGVGFELFGDVQEG